MEIAGFSQLPHEWWHFDALPKAQVKDQFTIVE
jgi:D-alanyl-D-alanine dipeptidase